MCNPLWLTAVCHEWPANMCSRSRNLAVRGGVVFHPMRPSFFKKSGNLLGRIVPSDLIPVQTRNAEKVSLPDLPL